jgi:hypothetical protein
MLNDNKTDLEFSISDELKDLGFSKFTLPLQGKNSFIWYKGRPIIISFDKNDLSKTVKSLTKRLQAEGIDQKSNVYVTIM